MWSTGSTRWFNADDSKARCDEHIFCLHTLVSGLDSAETHVWPITIQPTAEIWNRILCAGRIRSSWGVAFFVLSLGVLFEEGAFRLRCPLLTSESTESFKRSGWGCREALRSMERRRRKKGSASSLSESAIQTSGDAVRRPPSGRDLMANTNMHLYERLMATCRT